MFLHVGGGITVAMADVVAILPRTPKGAVILLADGQEVTTMISPATLRKRLQDALMPFQA